MLHRSFYEVLPYLYLAAGVGCALLVNSTLISIASLLLIMAGMVVLLMRYRFRSEQKRLRCEIAGELHFAADHYENLVQAGRGHIFRTDRDRRQRPATEFPLEDASGRVVDFDRRNGERRHAFV
jgi:hypothetical protein